MTEADTHRSPRELFSIWVADELQPAQILKSVSAMLLLYIIEVIAPISFAALIFSGPLSGYLPSALSFILIGDALLVTVVALLSSYRGSIAVVQDAPAVILRLGAASIAAALAANGHQTRIFPTILGLIIIASLSTGIFFLLLGHFKLGGLVRFLPYPVMGGFLAGTGWLVIVGGIGVMVELSSSWSLFQTSLWVRWLPGVVLGLLMFLISNRWSSPLVLPGLFGLAGLAFYAVAWILHISAAELMAGGWLLGPFQSGLPWTLPFNPGFISQVDWPVLLGELPIVLPVAVVSVVSMLLNANSLELIVKRDIDLDKELIAAGWGNLSSGLAGGLVGYQAISSSVLNQNISKGRRLPGFLVALALSLTVVLGSTVLSYIPRMILAGLLIYIGMALLYEWVFQAWYKFPKSDFPIILSILVVIAVKDYLWGIALGLVLTILIFVFNYSRINVIKHALSGVTYHSRVTRNLAERKILEELGEQIYILKLQGYLFFGTANSLFEQVRSRVRRPGLPAVRFVIQDFSQVSGLDSTGLLSFARLLQLAQEHAFTLILTGLHGRVEEQFKHSGFDAHTPDERSRANLRIFADLDRGVEWCENQIVASTPASAQPGDSLYDHLMAIVPDRILMPRLIEWLHCQQYAAGEYIIHQGDEPVSIFFIESGQVTAWLEPHGPGHIQDPASNMRLETMMGGRIVGELGFYLGTPRSASVIVDEPSVIYSLSRQAIKEMEETAPEVADLFHRVVIRLLGERVAHLMRVVNALQRF